MICLGDPDKEEPGSLLRLLDVLFSDKISAEDKQKILQDEFNIHMTPEMQIEGENIMHVLDIISKKSLKKGRAEGEQKNAKKVAIRLLKIGKMSLKEIAYISGLSFKKVKKLHAQVCLG